MRYLQGSSAPFVPALAVIALALAGFWHCHLYAADQRPGDQALAALGAAIQKAFNAHDASALSALWTDGAVHHSASTGAELSGRQAIADAYAKLFKGDPGCSLSIDIQSTKVETDGSARIVGVAQVDHPGRAATRSLFEARLTRAGGSWLLARVDEADLPRDATAGLSPLAWLVGRWGEELPGGRVVNEFRWVDAGAFLLRDYWSEKKDGLRIQGREILGWDAEQSCIRTWLFDCSGSFGEGYWKADGPSRWVNKLAIKLPDGRRAAVTQVLERVGNDQLTVQSIDREIDGAAQPNGPVAKLVRQTDPAQKSPAGAGSTKGELP